MEFDIDEFDSVAAADAGAVMQVLDRATNLPMEGVTITIVGEDSERFRKAQHVIANRRTAARIVSRNMPPSAEEMDVEVVDLMASCVIGWTGFFASGLPIDQNHENVKKTFKRHPWLLDQALIFRANRANFMKASPKS